MKPDIELLLEVCPEAQRAALEAYIHDLCLNDEWYGIDESFLGFMADYEDLARMLKRHVHKGCLGMPDRNFTIYDVGCATGLQHLFFAPFVKYVGIDRGCAPEPKFFLPNCTFIRGRFVDVVSTLSVGPDAFGIANMSLLYGGGAADLEAFNRVFKRKWVV